MCLGPVQRRNLKVRSQSAPAEIGQRGHNQRTYGTLYRNRSAIRLRTQPRFQNCFVDKALNNNNINNRYDPPTRVFPKHKELVIAELFRVSSKYTVYFVSGQSPLFKWLERQPRERKTMVRSPVGSCHRLKQWHKRYDWSSCSSKHELLWVKRRFSTIFHIATARSTSHVCPCFLIPVLLTADFPSNSLFFHTDC